MSSNKRRERKTFRVDQHPGFESLPKDRCTLTMLTGPTPGAIHPVSPGADLILGRDDDLPAHIEDRGISGRHARIYAHKGAFYVEDLDSTNGTFVNGRRIAGPHLLRDTERIQLGENSLLRVSLQDATEQEAARRMYQAAVLDPLTGVYNRGHFDASMVAEFAFAVRHAVALSILFLDLDHFTQVNTDHGHQGGDAVLRATAQLMKNAVRLEDMVTRYGGEEFVIIARGIRSDGALIMGERLRRTIENTTVPFRGKAIRVTASIGIATYEPHTPFESHEQLVAAADRAVYRAKANGRNRVCQAFDTASDSWRSPPFR